MQLYQVTRRLVDQINGLVLQNGAVVKTADTEWVKRHGTALRPVTSAPATTQLVLVEKTQEQKAVVVKAETVAKEERKPAKKETAAVERKAPLKRQRARVTDESTDSDEG